MQTGYSRVAGSSARRTGIRGKLSQDLAGRDSACRHGGRDPQNVRPVRCDQTFPDLAADQRAQIFRGRARIERVEPFGLQDANAWNESLAEVDWRQCDLTARSIN